MSVHPRTPLREPQRGWNYLWHVSLKTYKLASKNWQHDRKMGKTLEQSLHKRGNSNDCKYVKRSLTSLVITVVQMRYYYIPTKRLKLSKVKYWVLMTMYLLSLENWQYLRKLNRCVHHEAAFSLQCIYPREPSAFGHQKMYTRMFTAGLFAIANKWKQLTWPSIAEWIKVF